jgi:hypothetical protein
MLGNVLGLILLVSLAANASSLSELQQVQDSDQLARFIHRRLTGTVSLKELIEGIQSSDTLRIPSYATGIPVREVYGTIIAERWEAELGADFYRSKRYDVRAICAFRDAKDNVWRFHITVFEAEQYRLMETLLKELVNRAKRSK